LSDTHDHISDDSLESIPAPSWSSVADAVIADAALADACQAKDGLTHSIRTTGYELAGPVTLQPSPMRSSPTRPSLLLGVDGGGEPRAAVATSRGGTAAGGAGAGLTLALHLLYTCFTPAVRRRHSCWGAGAGRFHW
jgi:hypothetical protein